MNIFRKIRENTIGRAVCATVLDGSFAGERALITNDASACFSDGASFLPAHLTQLEGPYRSRTKAIDGASVFLEPLGHEKKLILCGGGHVSMPVIRIAKMLGFQVTVIEDREEFAKNAQAAGADKVICGDYAAVLDGIESDPDTYFVTVTRGHRFDHECLDAILRKDDYAYVGMMGSRRRTAMLREDLVAEGLPEDKVASLHAPIGLPIAAETPEEIAVSILAEIIKVKNESGISCAYPENLLDAILADDGRSKVLATIISKKGSGPRSIGTKMLIRDDRSIVGTIGGGCAEMYTITRAVQMIDRGEKTPKIITVDMTSTTAADEGLACGGVMQIYLEQL